jgi:chromosome segregation protein
MADAQAQTAQETYECPECGDTFDSVRGMHVHEGQKHPDKRVEDLEALVDDFEDDANQAVMIKRERDRLKSRLKQLTHEKEDLEDTVSDLRSTRNELKTAIEEKEDEVEELEDQLHEMKDEKEEVEAEKESLERKVENLKEEKERMAQSLEKTEDLLLKFKHQVDELNEDLN